MGCTNKSIQNACADTQTIEIFIYYSLNNISYSTHEFHLFYTVLILHATVSFVAHARTSAPDNKTVSNVTDYFGQRQEKRYPSSRQRTPLLSINVHILHNRIMSTLVVGAGDASN